MNGSLFLYDHDPKGFSEKTLSIDLLMGAFRGPVFHCGRVPENCPLALMGRLPSLMGPFSDLNGPFIKCLNGPFSLFKIPCKTAH